jgi:hypothetical protein
MVITCLISDCFLWRTNQVHRMYHLSKVASLEFNDLQKTAEGYLASTEDVFACNDLFTFQSLSNVLHSCRMLTRRAFKSTV